MKNFNFFQNDKGSAMRLNEILVELLIFLQAYSKDKPLYFDSADVKQLLKISDKTLYRMRNKGDIPYFKIGKKYLYPIKFFTDKII